MWGEYVEDRGQLWELVLHAGETQTHFKKGLGINTCIHLCISRIVQIWGFWSCILSVSPFPCSHTPIFISTTPHHSLVSTLSWASGSATWTNTCMWDFDIGQKWAFTSFTTLWVCSAPLASSYRHEYRCNGSSKGCDIHSSAWAFMVF